MGWDWQIFSLHDPTRGRSIGRADPAANDRRRRRSVDGALRGFLQGHDKGRPGGGAAPPPHGRRRRTTARNRCRTMVAAAERASSKSTRTTEGTAQLILVLAKQRLWRPEETLTHFRDIDSRHATQHEMRKIWATHLAHRGRPPDTRHMFRR
mgnify:CR=1 FL=1